MAPRSDYTSILEAIDAGRRALLRSRLSRGLTRFAAVAVVAAAAVVLLGLLRQVFNVYSVPAAGAVSILALGVMVAAFIRWVLWPALRLPDRNGFVTLVEKRYPEAENQLVNAYQLGREESLQRHAQSRDVIDAVVAKANQTLGAFDLKTWSSPRDDRGYILAGAGSAAVLAVLAVTLAGPFKDAVAQGLNPSLAAPPPVYLTVLPGDATVDRGSDLQVGVRVEGTGQAPTLMFREPGGDWRYSTFAPQGDRERHGGNWVAGLERIERNMEYAVTAPRAESDVYRVMVNDPPRLQGFRLHMQPPAYTRLPAESMDSASGDIAALKGSQVDLRVLTNVSIPGGYLEWHEDGRDAPRNLELSSLDATQWQADLAVLQPGSYAVVLADSTGRELLRSPRYRVDPLLDRAPYMTLHLPQEDHDLYEDMMERVVADAADDYGFSAAEIVYRIDDGAEQVHALSPFTPGQTEFRLDTLWDLSGLNMIPGQVLSFYLRIVDNDAVTGPKAVQSDVRRVRFPTVAEMYEEVAEEHGQEIDRLSDLQQAQQEMNERLEKISEDLKKGQDKDWETEQEVKATLERQEQLEQQLQEVSERLQDTLEKADSRADMSQSLVQKMSQLNELLESLSNEDLKRSFQRLSNALNKQSSDELRRAMEDFQNQQEEMLAGLDRTIELLKQIRKEEQVDDMVRRTQEIAELQEQIAEAMEALGGTPPEPQENRQDEPRDQAREPGRDPEGDMSPSEPGPPEPGEQQLSQDIQDLQKEIDQLEKELTEELRKDPAGGEQSQPGKQGGKQEAKQPEGEQGDKKPGDQGEGEPQEGDKKPGEQKSGDQKPGDQKPGDPKQGESNNEGEQSPSPDSQKVEQLKKQLEALKEALDKAQAEALKQKGDMAEQQQSGESEQQQGEQNQGEQQQGEQQQGEQQQGEKQQGQQQQGQQSASGEQKNQPQDSKGQEGQQSQQDQQQQGEQAANPQEQEQMAQLAKQQEELRRKLEELKRRLEQLRKMHEEDQRLAQNLEEMEKGRTSEDLSQNMEQSQQAMSQGQKQESTFYAFKAKEEANRLAQMAESAQQQMQEGLQDDTVAKMERIIQGLIDVSRVEERLSKDPHEDEREQARHQFDLVERTQAVADSLNALSRQTFAVEAPDQRQLEDTIVRMERATRLYEMGNRRAGNHESRESVSDLNETIVKLMKGHQQMCGGSGSGSGSMQQLMEQMQGLSQAQEMLNEQSGRASQSGEGRLSQSEQRRLEWLAAQQEMIRQGLEEVQREFRESESLLGDMESLTQEMQEVEGELRDHNLDRRVLERQQKILSRLLDAQRSVRQQEMSPKRQSRTGTLAERQSPPPIPEDLVQRDRALEEDVLRGAQDRYPSQFRKLVEDYFKALTEQTRTP